LDRLNPCQSDRKYVYLELGRMFSFFKRRVQTSRSKDDLAVSFGPCIFCAGQIAETDQDPLSLQVSESGGRAVVWFAHARCLAERISPTLGEFTEPERSEWLTQELNRT
jgi:hypothetical protein